MSDFDRRQFLKGILGKMACAAGTVVVASAATSKAGAKEVQPTSTEASRTDLEQRADRLAAAGNPPAGADAETFAFLNGGFRNTPLGSFRNTPVGGFRNTPFSTFRNAPVGGFRNAPLGVFRNTPLGPFANGGWPNGGWWGGFHNGGWPNHGWPNWW